MFVLKALISGKGCVGMFFVVITDNIYDQSNLIIPPSDAYVQVCPTLPSSVLDIYIRQGGPERCLLIFM